MSIDELNQAHRDIVDLIVMLPLDEREARYTAEIEKLPRDARRFVASVVTARIAILPPETLSVNVLCEPGAVTQIGTGPMSNTSNTQNIAGGTFNAPVGINQAFSNCYNIAGGAAQPDVQALLKAMIAEVEKLHPQLGEVERNKAERKMKLLVDEAAQKDPDKEQLALSGKGLIEAAKTCAEMAGPVILTVKAVMAFFGIAAP